MTSSAFNEPDGSIVFEGNVRYTAKEMDLQAEKLTLFSDGRVQVEAGEFDKLRLEEAPPPVAVKPDALAEEEAVPVQVIVDLAVMECTAEELQRAKLLPDKLSARGPYFTEVADFKAAKVSRGSRMSCTKRLSGNQRNSS